jgi:hypothetical protein
VLHDEQREQREVGDSEKAKRLQEASEQQGRQADQPDEHVGRIGIEHLRAQEVAGRHRDVLDLGGVAHELERRERQGDLPRDMRQEDQRGEGAGDPEARGREQPSLLRER